MKTGLLFDLDGTLLDTLTDLHRAVCHTLAQFSCPPRTRDEVRQFVGNGAGVLMERALPNKPDDPPLGDVLAAFHTYYDAHCSDNTQPYAGILDALALLRREHPIAIVSNKPDSAVKLLCKRYFGDLPAFGERAGCPRKPAPDLLLRAMDTLGADDYLYIGDSEVDVATAKNAAIECLSVLWGFRSREVLERAGAAHFCASPDALPRAIRQLEEHYGK